MPAPLRYIGDTFHYAGVWWRAGRVQSYVIDGPDDTSDRFRGRVANCQLCVDDVEHSTAAHRAARRAMLKTAICTPGRSLMVELP